MNSFALLTSGPALRQNVARVDAFAGKIMQTFYSDRLNWKSLGYSAPPTPQDDAALRKDPEYRLWIRAQELLEEAKKGTFSNVHELIDIHNIGMGAVLKSRCARILGDAGTSDCFVRIKDELLMEFDKGPDFDIDKLSNFSEALWSWGDLSVIPVLVKQYQYMGVSPASDIIPIRLSLLLEKGEWGEIADVPEADRLEEYCKQVLQYLRSMRKTMGAEEPIIYGGEPWSVKKFARNLLDRIGDRGPSHTFDTVFRRKFEASTGTNCVAFFEAGGFRPLAAAEIVDDFFESGQSERYEDGVRYFFGHRIPN